MNRAQDIAIVTRTIDPYLTKTIIKKSYDRSTGRMDNVSNPVIVDDGALPGNHPMMTGSQIATAQLLEGLKPERSSEAWWFEYGKRVHESFEGGNPIGIRCDPCTALAFYLLRANNCAGSITVVEQAKGEANGHWFLLVGAPTDAAIAYEKTFPRGSFIVDLWGAGVKKQRGEGDYDTAVFDPPECVYSCGDNSLKRRANHAGRTTVPTTRQFVTATTVAGCIGNKSRSTSLQTLDTALDQYLTDKISLKNLGDAFKTWTDKKTKRQGDAIDSIRNKDGSMSNLKQQLLWLGAVV